ncbi:MAG: ABC transporter ATP-binding protein [Proteobacteria bacterium]|nr:ABC transporter ATP-binding protein [Cystobacterineae bacterium]MCL2259134.1 ABC transporter ATP-binding protein [Cystobacterineae bacterium]MCL2314115.1 ABC transporter ATP-binding protein [Pseudomonadota bacterium]
MRKQRGLHMNISAQVGSLEVEVALGMGSETLVLAGPNGAGKTTLLLLLLGALPCKKAHIQIGETLVADSASNLHVPTEDRHIGYVPQEYALFPHLSVRENVAFALRSRSSQKKSLVEKQVEAALQNFGIAALADKKTCILSGGEKQRVALSRALSLKPHALLLDEPLSALDICTRKSTREFLLGTLKNLSVPSIVVTHDAAEARMLGQRIAIMESGKITQMDTWEALSKNPKSAFVEAFVSGSNCLTHKCE